MVTVAVSGALVSGKTTLVRAIASGNGRMWKIIPDLPRAALNVIGWDTLQYDPIAFQHYIGLRQIMEEAAIAKSDSCTICDKSLVDAIAYWDVLVGTARPHWASVLNSMRYAAIFICDPNDISRDKADEYQQRHWDFRSRIHEAILSVCADFHLDYALCSGTVEERSRSAMDTINGLGLSEIEASDGACCRAKGDE